MGCSVARTANSSCSRTCQSSQILSLYSSEMQEVLWLEEVAQTAKAGSLRTGLFTFADRVFQNDVYVAVQETRQVMPCSYICPQQISMHVDALPIDTAAKSD